MYAWFVFKRTRVDVERASKRVTRGLLTSCEFVENNRNASTELESTKRSISDCWHETRIGAAEYVRLGGVEKRPRKGMQSR